MKLRVLIYAVMAALLLLPSFASAAENTGTITGTVHDTSGSPVADARIVATGEETRTVSSDSAGKFTLTLTAGFYRLDVSKGGYTSSTETDLAVLTGENLPVDVVMQQADLGSLKTIARLTTSAGSSINTGTASISITTRQQFADLGSPQINDVVQRIPGAYVEKGSSSPNTSFTLAGAQGYESQVLIDGHPVSIGKFGVLFSQFFNSFLVGNVEAQLGPGNTTPFAGTAIGGTLNISTPGYTKNQAYKVVTGLDNLAGNYTNVLYSGGFGKLSYVAGAGISGVNTPYTGRYGCVLNAANKSTWNTPGAVGVISFCGDLGGGQLNKGEVLKAKWDFSPTTSLELGYLGSQAGYNPQGSAYGLIAPNTTVTGCLVVGGVHECNNPAYNGMVGQTINGFFFYPGSFVTNNMPMFSGQFRTAVGNNTLLVRPYGGSITRIINGDGESGYGLWWTHDSGAAATKACVASFGAFQTSSTPGGWNVCQDMAYTTVENDKMRGATLSFIHPMGTNQLTFTYDYHSDETYSQQGNYLPGGGLPVDIPDTMAKYNSLSLTGDFALTNALTLKAGAYENLWWLNGWQVTGLDTNKKPVLGPLQRTVGVFDPHVALTYQPRGGFAVRLAAGTSTTFPYAGQVSGPAHFNSGNTTVPSLSAKNPFLNPEKAFEVDLGFDKRLHDGSVVSLDLLDTQVHNVFETTSTPVTNQPWDTVFEPVNAAKLSSRLATLTWRRQPLSGWGWYLSATADQSIPTGIPLTPIKAVSPTGYIIPANGVQQCSDGGNAVCIPYLKGYAGLEYTFADHTYAHVGFDYEGKNNTYFQPPLAIWDMTLRRPIPKTPVSVQLSVYNLLNTNTFGGLVTPNAGSAPTGEELVCPTPTTCTTQYGPYRGNYYPLLPVQPRTVRLQFSYGVGRT